MSKRRRLTEFLVHSAAVMLFLLFGFAPSAQATQYYYDQLGRITVAINSDGSVIEYEYDANGNVTSINKSAGTALSIVSFSPSSGRINTSITIYGTQFSSTANQNLVTIGGVSATVTSATSQSLTVTVPSSAVTGTISVTVAGATAYSAQNFIVLRPTISGFTPTLVNSGSAVTLNGNNLNLVSGQSTIKVGSTAVTVNSITNTQSVFVAPSTSGVVSVNTPYGVTTSAVPLVVLPASVLSTNVISYSTIDVTGTSQVIGINQANKYGVFGFNAVSGQLLSIQLSALSTTPANASVSYSVYSPTNTLFASGSVSSSNMSIHLPVIGATGQYLVVFSSGNNTAVQVTAALDLNSSLIANGNSNSFSTNVVSQSKRFVITGTAGQNLGLGLTNFITTPSSITIATVYVNKPDGSNWSSMTCYTTNVPGCQISLRNMPVTGNYTVRIVPNGQATMSFNLTLSQNVSGTLTFGTPMNVNLSVPGQNALLTFTATAGQTVALNMGSIVTVPSGKTVNAYVYNATGTQVGAFFGTTSATLNLTNLAVGTYSVLIAPQFAATATMQVTLASMFGGTLPVDGTTSATLTSTVQGQNGYFTFAGTAGQNLGLGLTNLSLTPSSITIATLYIDKPDGTNWSSIACNTTNVPGCQISLRNLPASGNYTVRIVPSGQATMSFKLTLSQDVGAALTLGTAQNVNLAAPGQNGLLTFTTSTVQTVVLTSTTILTAPAGKTVMFYVYNNSGTQVGSTNGTASATLTLTNLAAGTYSILVAPQYAATATMQVRVQ